MSILRVLVVGSILWICACAPESPAYLTDLNNEINTIRQRDAPDKRIARFQIEPVINDRGLVLRGHTDQPEAFAELKQWLAKRELPFQDSVQVLPDPVLGDRTFGVVNLSACNIRSNPKHSAELATQSTLGTPLRIAQKLDNGWFLVQTPDDYFGYLDPGGFAWMDRDAYEDWMFSEKVVYVAPQGFVYQAPDERSVPVSDILEGNILRLIGRKDDFYEVGFPDGRTGFVAQPTAQSYREWIGSRQPTAENILAKASTFLGRPYLWGGTSGKGVDCSGFTKTVFYLNGLLLPRDASQQVHTGIEVASDTTQLDQLRPGDLLFFGRAATPERKERITHVAIYQGNGRIIHSSGIVCEESLNRRDPDFTEHRLQTFIRAKRILSDGPVSGIVELSKSGYY